MPISEKRPKYKRILLKLSGEALMGEGDFGIDPKVIKQIAAEIQELDEAGAEVAVVLGAGNFFRGSRGGDFPLTSCAHVCLKGFLAQYMKQ